MTFIGRLKQHSAISRRWLGEARVGGEIHGVPFYWEPGNIYRTLPLTPEQIERLQSHDNVVVLEIVSVDLPQQPDVAPPAKPVAQAARINSTPANRK